MTVIALAMVAVFALVPPTKTRSPRVRPITTHVADLVQRACERSPTVARLLAIIEASDIILQIDTTMQPAIPRAVTHLVTATGDVRYVRTIINRHSSRSQQIEMLAHELQHVVEIAQDPQVRDQDSMRVRFEQIGWRDGRHGPFETGAAVDTERLVRRELMGSAVTTR